MESIPMWNMYSSLEGGVRIGLPVMPFKEYGLSSDIVVSSIPDQILHLYKQGDIDIESYDIAKSPYFILKHMPMLYKINYSESAPQHKLKLKHILNSDIEEKLAQLGKHKRIYWGFQKEWRYVLILLPIAWHEEDKKPFSDNKRRISTIENTFFYIPFKFYYLRLNDQAFNTMQIVLSPKFSKGNRVFVELLKENYNRSMKISESRLKGNLR
jgi:hypothetical protein